MASGRQRDANTKNAQASTGPRTAAGKLKSSRNARKHGLSTLHYSPDVEAETIKLAKLLAGERNGSQAFSDACHAVAETHIHLRRIQAFKVALSREATLNFDVGNEDFTPSGMKISALLQKLERLERYERRAFSLRKSAKKRYDERRAQARREAAD